MMYNHVTSKKVEIGVSNGAANSRCTNESVSGFFASCAPITVARTEEAAMPRRCSIGTPTSFRAATFIGVKAGSNSTVTGAFTVDEISHFTINRFLSKVDKTDYCWNWTARKTPQGYGRFSFEGKNQTASRVAYKLFIGPIEGGLHVLHTCDNPSCVNPDHLWLGTNAENIADRMQKGRTPSMVGEKNSNRKLTKLDVLEIRIQFNSGVGRSVLAEKYGIATAYVNQIAAKTAWSHL